MGRTGVSSDQRTGMIQMDEAWWREREAENRLIRSFHRRPPRQWEAAERIFKWSDVSTQHMYDVDGVRRELDDERLDLSDGDGDGNGDGDGDGNDSGNGTHETPINEYIPQPQDENPPYPDLSFIDSQEPRGETPFESGQEFSHASEQEIPVTSGQVNPDRMGRQNTRTAPYSVGRGESNRRRGASRGRLSTKTERGPRRRREFEGSMSAAFHEMASARRATVSALRPDRYNQEDYEKFKEALAILNSLPIEKYNPFWKAASQLLKEDAWWRNTFLDTHYESDDERIKFLESITGVDRAGTNTNVNLQNFQPFLSGSSSGSVRSSSSSVGHSSGNSDHSQGGIP
ncbi:unnamed protein product [Microthlaspi erraticum]|uniref:Uncharacterized protein n=1 Tax=Microthlaspi erraticum TaxID=1685480 RepID=A0A6D2HSV9_9BRAS|nr:unnamed protein product [Microthlaspi erraticum]